MIDPAYPVASWFLWIIPAVFIGTFGLPLLIAPVRWARIWQWRIPEDHDLAVYFGRCLGAVVVALAVGCFRAAPHPAANGGLVDIVAVALGLVALVHVWGFIRRIQPWTEDVETVGYIALTALTIWIRAGLP